jgi:hypothetical protein
MHPGLAHTLRPHEFQRRDHQGMPDPVPALEREDRDPLDLGDLSALDQARAQRTGGSPSTDANRWRASSSRPANSSAFPISCSSTNTRRLIANVRAASAGDRSSLMAMVGNQKKIDSFAPGADQDAHVDHQRLASFGSHSAVPLASGGRLLSRVKLKQQVQELTLGAPRSACSRKAAILRDGLGRPGVAMSRLSNSEGEASVRV